MDCGLLLGLREHLLSAVELGVHARARLITHVRAHIGGELLLLARG